MEFPVRVINAHVFHGDIFAGEDHPKSSSRPLLPETAREVKVYTSHIAQRSQCLKIDPQNALGAWWTAWLLERTLVPVD